MCNRHERGMTLIELMIVVVVVAILASIAIPSYRSSVIRSGRSEAQTALLQVQTAQEKFYLQNNAYAASVTAAPPGGLGLTGTSESGTYDIAVALGAGGAAQSFIATATPVIGRGQDQDTQCVQLTINESGVRTATPGGVAKCWR